VKASESVGGSTADLTKKNKGSLSSLNKVLKFLKQPVFVIEPGKSRLGDKKVFFLPYIGLNA
jgi:hypothetical protein